MDKIKLTKKEYDELKKELEKLEKDERAVVAKLLKEAIEQGDLGENDAYHQAKDRQARLEMRIRELAIIIKQAIIVEKTNSGKVQVGSILKVKNSDGKEQGFTIVSAQNSDPSSGKISYDSPIGNAFMGHEIKEKIKIKLPSGVKEYIILEIN
ncbi:MAG: hypothetical protein A3F94_02410 [Candidatus Spechtbacteria bacterium RIFCSPLOWO2_12_FULL_38_22]|uniref:Transcription elongation factor GreA n=1 Tax=Candidatus Spechtbacteria bacterium RIFCSPLOWO2_12_FULL_38_22 TaxID=1802165 RepID=A0A1G2HIG9_9BACT|nr:MAG: hypothetical protein A2728_03290 [Candidatus Spechtbacteria bacterium RIFCSPHIGHO2_01_FULL_38_11]OGZ59376.1 MAG: hypothetical protein A3A00_00490 [Candidatus Spechtbacteria bacterium RIFCSPLOWO2_01_FULL_38_20]OGZ59892.1 MAG: hypothetical protein A3E58_00525 [Candidatus Spechtbacteria bacterium RIFCSPHIGHO2_12_FULL_38_30]OGZ62060.1 MAG: hypothetical protein A3F94_02410 [Candidatus Spechtbacteria bacterium RIFCSPLOWO2_12_FULL_38_22]